MEPPHTAMAHAMGQLLTPLARLVSPRWGFRGILDARCPMAYAMGQLLTPLARLVL